MHTPEAAAMARQLSAALAENWGVIPSTHMMAHDHLPTPVPGDPTLFFDLHGH